mgnify:FL=1
MSFFDNVKVDFLQDKYFLKQLENNPIKEMYLKVQLLTFNETSITEIQSKCITGSLNLDGNSSIRRTCSFSILVDEETYNLSNLDNLIAINKKIKLYIGYVNNIRNFEHYGEIVWFPLGVFVITSPSISHGLEGATINITAKDKMCLLNGEVGGKLSFITDFAKREYKDENNETQREDVPIYQIIRESVIQHGGENPAKVIINDVPSKIRTALRYNNNVKSIYFDKDSGEEIPSKTENCIEVGPQQLIGNSWGVFYYPTKELIKQPGETVTSLLDDIVNILGNYEYFYDIDGNFIFQEIKNYFNTSYVPITELYSGDYIVNLGETYIAYSFKDTNIVQSYSNTPNWLNIKNDFIVWGKGEDSNKNTIPIRYHVVIDDKPIIPEKYAGHDWRAYLYYYGMEAQQNGVDPGYYFKEVADLDTMYDFDKKEWKIKDSANLTNFLDFIDARGELGKFSVKAIGRRVEAIVDDDVKCLYSPDTPDYLVFKNKKSLTQNELEEIEDLKKQGEKILYVSDDTYNFLSTAYIKKDAFGVIRDLIMKHTTYSESITVTALPLYYLEPNMRIEVEDTKSNIYGDYMIQSISLPLSYEGLMSINAIRATNRL